MREYKIKRGHNPDINALVSRYFGATGDIEQGMQFSIDGIGAVNMKQEKNSLIIDIVPPKTICGDYSIIKKWNEFLFEATGKDAKERKKEFGR
ncbi:hypothetical protein AYK25_04530 [Thermoplasmatales archaeon SM1-50]|nr:MAG: hypothetical protein AYK25_04530 [Thermoplasmatales archaeon SM1-50]